jgi:peptidoglycan/LPS O-acetylase OafA/YrhL
MYEKHGLPSIQALRAITAIAVALAHACHYLEKELGIPNSLPGSEFGSAGVDLFFVISGFVMVYASERFFRREASPAEFFLRRLARIVPLYWVTTSIILAYLLLHYGSLQAVHFSPAVVIASYLFIPYPQTDGYMAPVHGVGWSLNFEMFFYVCFCLALPLGRRPGVAVVTAFLVGLVAIDRTLPPPLDYLAEPIVLEFAMGMLIALAVREGYRLPVIVCAALASTGVAGFVLSYWHTDIDHMVVWGIPSALVVAGVTLAKAPLTSGPLARGVSFLGDASYSLYLVHPIAVTLPRRLLGPYPNAAAPCSMPRCCWPLPSPLRACCTSCLNGLSPAISRIELAPGFRAGPLHQVERRNQRRHPHLEPSSSWLLGHDIGEPAAMSPPMARQHLSVCRNSQAVGYQSAVVATKQPAPVRHERQQNPGRAAERRGPLDRHTKPLIEVLDRGERLVVEWKVDGLPGFG